MLALEIFYLVLLGISGLFIAGISIKVITGLFKGQH
jgi:hypothetical protein